ncbi:GtrA family protein [Leekyejoonella antrihumi]|uniref:GtrA family protein n=1 Tax=Leekyejoonella antrihumi TaxID=1660198 RepID=UPI001FE5DE7B|nr:GtrA family protein [Leekyejoonella antrihumi]
MEIRQSRPKLRGAPAFGAFRPGQPDFFKRLRRLTPQLARFGVIGVAGFVVDVGGFNLLRYYGHDGPLFHYPLTAKVISGGAATVVAWLGNRYWTFRNTRREQLHREFVVFSIVSIIGIGIGLACLGISHYVMGFHSSLDDNIAANGVGLVLATGFRFWAYRQHVFVQTAAPPPSPVGAGHD